MIRYKSGTRWSDDREVGDVVCDPHRTRGGDKKRRFSSLASKPLVTVCQWFGLKTTATVICTLCMRDVTATYMA
jgi:hypothetical protein